MVTTPGTLSPPEIARVVARHFPASEHVTAVAVALAESGGDIDVVSKPNNDRYSSRDRGLFQINDYWHKAFISQGTWADPDTNAAYAAQLVASSGWSPWTTYTTSDPDRSYKQHLDTARAAVGGAQGVTGEPAPTYPPGTYPSEPGFPAPTEPWESGKRLSPAQLYWVLSRAAGEARAAAINGTALALYLNQPLWGESSSYTPWGLTAADVERGAAGAGVTGDLFAAIKVPSNAAKIAHAVYGGEWERSPHWAQVGDRDRADAITMAGWVDNPTANGQPAGYDPFDQRTWDEGEAIEENPLDFITDPLAAIGRFFALLTTGEFWARAGLIGGGALLLVLAGYLLVKSELK